MRRYMGMAAALVLLAGSGWAAKPEPSASDIQTIIRSFAEKEAEFAKARQNYTYRQIVSIKESDDAGNPGGKFDLVSDIVFPNGKRTERIVRAPAPTLRMISLTPEDEQDLRSVQPFVLTINEIDDYQVDYLGQQQVDEIGCYVFAVKPKTLEVGQRYFQGQIWVDDKDLQIVKTYGRGVGKRKKGFDNQFPKFETFREQIDGKYWFPTYTTANDTLTFDTGQRTGIKMTVKYQDYKQFKSDVTITFGDEVKDQPQQEQPAAPKPPAAPKQ